MKSLSDLSANVQLSNLLLLSFFYAFGSTKAD